MMLKWLVVPEAGGSAWALGYDTKDNGHAPTGDYGHDWVVVRADGLVSAIAYGNKVLTNGDVDLFDDALAETSARRMFL